MSFVEIKHFHLILDQTVTIYIQDKIKPTLATILFVQGELPQTNFIRPHTHGCQCIEQNISVWWCICSWIRSPIYHLL